MSEEKVSDAIKITEEEIFRIIKEKGYYLFSKDEEEYRIFGLIIIGGDKFWVATRNDKPYMVLIPFGSVVI